MFVCPSQHARKIQIPPQSSMTTRNTSKNMNEVQTLRGTISMECTDARTQDIHDTRDQCGRKQHVVRKERVPRAGWASAPQEYGADLKFRIRNVHLAKTKSLLGSSQTPVDMDQCVCLRHLKARTRSSDPSSPYLASSSPSSLLYLLGLAWNPRNGR